ncbi:hypothetical protein GCM10023320_73910 [Pseudonocardia adelaidensis]|uniref:Uncharacterized protein n=1 Tax=Pseudonocardia adelaidensis TaxID=648754 RepID=A0ABP9P7Q7_9PSEU
MDTLRRLLATRARDPPGLSSVVMSEPHRPPLAPGPTHPRGAVPRGAWGGGHQPLVPTPGHGVVVAVTIALSAALVAGSAATGGGLVTLLVLLLAVGALVVPVALVGTLWARARPLTRALFAAAGAACLLLLVWAVVRIVDVLPTVTFPASG